MTTDHSPATKGDIERLREDLEHLRAFLRRRLSKERRTITRNVTTYFDRSVDAILDEVSPSLHENRVDIDSVREDHDRRLERIEHALKLDDPE
jgi:hypothetical protein